VVKTFSPSETPAMTNDEMKRLFGLRVQALRRRRGLTQEQLAEAVGKSVDTISNIERGFSSTRLETALSIADAVSVTLTELFDFDPAANELERKQRAAAEAIARQVRAFPPETATALSAFIDHIQKLLINPSKSEQ